jgi:hypothetical protein
MKLKIFMKETVQYNSLTKEYESANLKTIPTLVFYTKCYIGARPHAYAEKVACNLADKIIALTNYEKIG